MGFLNINLKYVSVIKCSVKWLYFLSAYIRTNSFMCKNISYIIIHALRNLFALVVLFFKGLSIFCVNALITLRML